MTPRRKWPEEAEWARLDTIGILGKIVLILVVISRQINDPEILRAINLVIALNNVCVDWLREAKSSNIPKPLDERMKEILNLYR